MSASPRKPNNPPPRASTPAVGQDTTHQQQREENHRRFLVAFKMDLQSIPDERLKNYTDGLSLITLKHESGENMPLCPEEEDDADGGVLSESNGRASVVSCYNTAPTGSLSLFTCNLTHCDQDKILADSDDDVPLKSFNRNTRRRRPTGLTRRKEAGLAKVKRDLWVRKLKNELTGACNDEVTDINPRKRRLIVDSDDSGEDDEIASPTSGFAPDSKRWMTVAESETGEENEDTKDDSSAANTMPF